jgi:hypothetical protein
MKYRGWLWYSSGITSKGFNIVLKPISFPFAINPLEYLIFESGVELKDIFYTDFS